MLTLFLGVAIYAVAWLFGAKALYPVALGLVLAPIAARTWVRLAARPIALRRRIGGGLVGRRAIGGHLFEGEDVWVTLEAQPEAARATALDLGHRADREARRAAHTAPARPRPLPRHVRDREGVARTLRRRGDEGDDRRPLRAGTLGGRSRPPPARCSSIPGSSHSIGSSRRAGRMRRTAGGCCCGAPRGSISTRCASTSRASHCERCTGGQLPGGAS